MASAADPVSGETIRDYEPGRDEAAVKELWARVFGPTRGGQTVEWLFRPGPGGPCPRAVAEIDGRLVAHAGVSALRFRVGSGGGDWVRAGYSVGAMTDSAYQGRRLFFRVGSHLYRRLEEAGFALVAGFSNANSHRLMTGPLQRRALRPFPWAVRVLRPFGLAASLLRAGRPLDHAEPEPLARGEISVSPIACGDPRLDAVWERARDEMQVGAVRDRAHALWRYGSRDDARYRLLLAERAGSPVGWLACRSLALRGVGASFVLDFVLAPGERPAGATLLDAAARYARAEGASVSSALLPGSGCSREALLAAGYRRIPEPLHPQTIRFSVRGLGRWAGSTLLVDPRAWHWSWADTDVV